MAVAGSPLAGQEPGVIKVRLSGALPDVETLAALLRLAALHWGGLDLIEVSPPCPNRRDPGARLYLTIRLTGDLAGPGAPPRRPAGPARLTAREES